MKLKAGKHLKTVVKPRKAEETSTFIADGYRYVLVKRVRPNGSRQPRAFGMPGMAIIGCKKINDRDK